VIIEKITDRDGTEIFEDKATKTKYARILGGLSWPGTKPAFVVVVAEDLIEDPTLKARHVRVLAEIEEPNLQTLFQKCLDLRDRYQVEDFYGNRENSLMMDFLYEFNRNLKEGVSPLGLWLAPFPEELKFHVYVVRQFLEQGKKILHFGEKSVLRGYLMELGKEEAMRAGVLDYPPIAALGYVLSHIKSYPFTRPKPRWRDQRPSSWRTV